MGALSLILGGRTDTSVLLHTHKKCVVEGFFSIIDNREVQQLLEQAALDNGEELILRREIATNGKTRAFINDTPVTVQQLREIALLMVDLHRQFDTQALSSQDFQREVIDTLANHSPTLQAYQTVYAQWVELTKSVELLQKEKTEAQKELDYHQFLLDELVEINLHPNELEKLEDELKLLNHSEGIKQALTQVEYVLTEAFRAELSIIKK